LGVNKSDLAYCCITNTYYNVESQDKKKKSNVLLLFETPS